MKDKDTLFFYMYQNLKERIINGQLKAGSRLTSSRKLSREYQVSIRTVMNVLYALREEGLIEIYPRKVPIICDHKNRTNFIIQTILAKQKELLSLYEAVVDIIPNLLTFSVRTCLVEELPHYKQAMKAIRQKSRDEWRQISEFCKEILCSSENPLFYNFHKTFEARGNLYFFMEEQFNITGIFFDFSSIYDKWSVIMKNQESVQLYLHLKEIYQIIRDTIEQVLECLNRKFPNTFMESEVQTAWNIIEKPNHYFISIARDLIQKIGEGIYPPETFLPHEAQLAQQYHVSVSTVRKALERLSELGFSKTFNVKGTLVLLPENRKEFFIQCDTILRQEILDYLYALQFMAVIIKGVAKKAASKFTADELKILKNYFKKPDSFSIDIIIKQLLNHLNSEVLKNILEQIRKVIRWGDYFISYRIWHIDIKLLSNKAYSIFQYLQTGDVFGFAKGIEDYYWTNLDLVRRFVTEKYKLTQAQELRIPTTLS